MTLDMQVIKLESAAQNAATFDAMKSGIQTMKKIRNDVGIKQVGDIMDEIKEEMKMENEVNNAIAQPVDLMFANEDELLAELEGLETADIEAESLAPLMRLVVDLSLTSVPASKLPQPKLENYKAEKLKNLEAELEGL